MPRLIHRRSAIGIISTGIAALVLPSGGNALSAIRTNESEKLVSISRGVDWLLAQQGKDGAFRSVTYGPMRNGAGITSLAAYALSLAHDYLPSNPIRMSIEQALAFLSKPLDSTGAVQAGGEPADYPTYATCYALLTAKQSGSSGHDFMRQKMASYLTAAQIDGTRASRMAMARTGAWDSVGGATAGDAEGAQVDIAITSLALRALQAEEGIPKLHFDRGEAFIERCQIKVASGNSDLPTGMQGGFHFVPRWEAIRNKGGLQKFAKAGQIAIPYGTATIDGIRGLLACGKDASDVRITSALEWLNRNEDFLVVPGFNTPETVHWRNGMRFYFWAGLAEILYLFSEERADWIRSQIASELLRMQGNDGLWKNESHEMREDDPLIATSFALLSLIRLHASEVG